MTNEELIEFFASNPSDEQLMELLHKAGEEIRDQTTKKVMANTGLLGMTLEEVVEAKNTSLEGCVRGTLAIVAAMANLLIPLSGLAVALSLSSQEQQLDSVWEEGIGDVDV